MKPTFTKIFPKGSVLVFSLIILSLMLVTSLTLLSSATLDRKASLSTGNSTRSFQVADSGIEQVLYQVYRQDHDTMADLADAISDADGCEDGIISSDAGWQVAFYEGDNGDTRITGCDDTDWRNRVTKIKSQGGAGSTTRAVEVAVAQTGLSCVQATRERNDPIHVYYEDGATATGDTAEVESPGTGSSSGSASWGLECVGGYLKTGCYIQNEGAVGSTSGTTDWDITTDPSHLQGCFSDDDEYDENAVLTIICCR